MLVAAAAVDGICLQTSESIGCAEELGLPAVVVLNKIDLLPEEEVAQVLVPHTSGVLIGSVTSIGLAVGRHGGGATKNKWRFPDRCLSTTSKILPLLA